PLQGHPRPDHPTLAAERSLRRRHTPQAGDGRRADERRAAAQGGRGDVHAAGLTETYALLLAYDGAAFRGWQKQPRMATVQGALEDAIRALLGKRYAVQGASRTDAGV